MALITSARGRHAEAIGQAETVVKLGEDLARRTTASSCACFAVRALTRVLLAAQEYERGLAWCEHGQELARLAGHASATAAYDEQAGDALMALGRPAEAADHYRQAVALYEGDSAERRRAACQDKVRHATTAARTPGTTSR
jgi:predicted negative regulator of RcsB-dependent stress response